MQLTPLICVRDVEHRITSETLPWMSTEDT